MFSLNPNSPMPIHNQLFISIKKLIVTDVFEENYKLPSVRALAKDLTVNPNTVHKVYQQLLDDGLVTSIPQKGIFVNKVPQHILNDYIDDLKKDFIQSYNNLADMNMTQDEILKLIK